MNELQNIRLSIIENKIVSLKNQIGRNMIEIGNELIKAKEEVNHGEWEKWLKNKVAFSQRSAEQLMRIAKEFGSNSQAISNLGVTKAGLLLGIPNEKREEFIEKNDVKSMSTRELKKAIKQSIDNEHYGNVIDLEMDMEEYDIPIRDLKELPEHNEFFASRKGKEWIDFLNAIDKYGVTKPIKISRDKTIIDGHERVRACKDLGIDTIKCKYAFEKEQNRKNYTDEQLKLKLFSIIICGKTQEATYII